MLFEAPAIKRFCLPSIYPAWKSSTDHSAGGILISSNQSSDALVSHRNWCICTFLVQYGSLVYSLASHIWVMIWFVNYAYKNVVSKKWNILTVVMKLCKLCIPASGCNKLGVVLIIIESIVSGEFYSNYKVQCFYLSTKRIVWTGNLGLSLLILEWRG